MEMMTELSEKKGIRIGKENIVFRRLLMETPGAERIMLCYQCGVCTADCPVALRVKEFRPRRIARLAVLGQKERLLEGDTLWLCAGCYTCYERCPEEVRVSEIISALRKLALKEGIIHPKFKALMKSIAEMREDEGWPLAPEPEVKEFEAIMRKTGFLDLVEGC